MASNASRKRRHKSKEKSQGVNNTKYFDHQEIQQKQKQQKQDQPQQQQSHQLLHHQQHHHHQQQPSSERSQSNVQASHNPAVDRLVPSRQPDIVKIEPQEGNHTEDTTHPCITSTTGQTDGALPLHEDSTDINVHLNNCSTALQSAVTWKHHSMVEMLLQKGADVAGVSETGQNSLMLAAYNGDVPMMIVLWSYGRSSLNINSVDKEGNTALHLCTFGSCKEGVTFLLERGADAELTNNQGKSPLHIAAHRGHLGICELLLKHLVPATDKRSSLTRGILCEDAEGKTPICEALSNQHLTVMKLLMEACSPQETLEFYMKNIQKLSNMSINDPSVDVQPILASLLFVVKRLQKDYLREMAEVQPMQHLVHAIRHCITSPRVLSTACLLISILVWKDCSEEESAGPDFEDNELSDIQDALMLQFLECQGPDAVIEKLGAQMFTAHDTYLIVSTLLPVMILASRDSGRVWLEQNSGNLSFYKELLTRNKAFITHISLNNHPGLQVGHVIKTFLSFVEETEAKDREQNLAQLLEEEERDRLKRERKKRKRQKKHNKQVKTDVAVATDADVSTDDESGECVGWGTDSCRSSEIFSNLGDVPVDKEQAHLYYPLKHNRQQDQQNDCDDKYVLHRSGPRHAVVVAGKTSFPSEDCLVSEKFLDREVKWHQSASVSEEFPPILAESDDRSCSDAGEGWVKVEGRKQSIKTTSRQSSASLLHPIKRQEATRPAPMRWADVAKIGCCRDSSSRNLTVLLGNMGRYPVPDYCKMSVLPRSSTTQSLSELGDSGGNIVDTEVEDWQQVARNAFADNMASKQTDDEQDLVVRSSGSSDSESDALSSTLSSECPSGQSEGLHVRKKTVSVVDDFDRPDASATIDPNVDKSEHYAFRSTFSNYHGEPHEIKSFIFDDADHNDDKSFEFLGDRGKHLLSKRLLGGEDAAQIRDDKLPETAWSRAEAKPAMAFSQVWGLTPRTKSLDILDGPVQSSSEQVTSRHCTDSNEEELTMTNISRSKTPPADSCVETVDRSQMNHQFPSIYCPNAYYDTQQGNTIFRNSNETGNKLRPSSFSISYQKNQEALKSASSQWCFDNQQTTDYNLEQHPWLNKETTLLERNNSTEWDDVLNVDNILSTAQQQNVNRFMPSFASMASAVDNNPIVTSVVESVLTPAVTSLSSISTSNKPPTYSSKTAEIPSPPPGFKFQTSNAMRLSNFENTHALLNNQTSLTSKNPNFRLSGSLSHHDLALQMPTFSSGDTLNYDSLRQAERQLVFDSFRSRSPMSGIVGTFTKAGASEAETIYPTSQQHHQMQQQQYFQSLSGSVFHPAAVGSGIIQGLSGPDNRSEGSAQALYQVQSSGTHLMPGETLAESWADRFRSLVLSTATTTTSLSQPQYSSCSTGSNIGDFSTILSGRLQQRQTLRHQDSQHAQLKRLQQQYQDMQVKSFQEAVDNCQRRYSEQTLAQQQRQHQFYSHTLQQSFRLNVSQAKAITATAQLKQPNNLHQHHSRPQQQQRLPSPPVLFPSDLRDEPESQSGEKSNSPVFQDMNGSDPLSDLFADPLLVERIAINQIRQQVLASQANNMVRDTAMSALRDSVYCNDLEYYASLYRLKLKDLLVTPPPSEKINSEAAAADRACGLMSRSDHDKASLICPRNHVEGRCVSPKRDIVNDRFSRRWREALNKILDTAWTMRHQFGDIVLPNSLSEFNISQVEYPLVLGFTTDGCEVAVLILEKAQAYIDPYLLDIMCDPELDHHFILKCKGMSETCSTEYIALDLCDYTLAEYMQIVQLSHRQDPLSTNRLAWQLLEGLKFIHHNLSMAHGNLKPSWIFVDSEGRLRLAGYGIVTKQSGVSLGNMRSNSDRFDSDRPICWTATEDLNNDQAQPSMASDIQVAGMLLYFILTGGQHPFGTTLLEADVNLARNPTHLDLISDEANDLVSGMLFPDPAARPTVEHCLKHPFFWSSEKKFRLILIVGSDVLTEMKTGIALTGNGSPTMTEILSILDITDVSPNWVQAINPTVMKEMRSFRVYKNSLSELTLFIYNCCLHFDKMSTIAKEVLDDPCKYFQMLFPSLFMAIFRSLKVSDRTDRTCYKPFFS